MRAHMKAGDVRATLDQIIRSADVGADIVRVSTPDEASTRAAVESFKVFADPEKAASAPGGYTMSHSSSLYLLGPRGDWLRQFEYGTPADDITADLKGRL